MRLFLRTLAITICFALSNASVQAQVITAEHAQEIADSFFSNGMKRSAAARTAVSLAKSADSSILTRGSSNEAPTFHIISNPDGKGFVIVSGEEIENPIIGYSFDSEFTADGEMPTGLADYLSDIDAQVKALRKYNAANPQKAAAARSVMQRTNYAATTMGDKVYLETASWGQNTPFNNQCFISYGSTTNAKTGCVPTAYAIIMRYHEWPLSGTGTLYNSQASTYVEITDRTYDYSKMPLVYDGNWSEEQINEVAKLMSHLGHAFMVTYGESSTSVSDPNSTYIPNKYFNYNLVDASYQKDFTINAWEEKIKESINNGCPIPYASDNAATGDTRHMFVLDGYTENDYFHFNFGWNGGSNGWFLLDAIKTSQGDDYSWQDGAEHYAIFNFTPNKTQYTVNASVSPTDAGTVSINGGETASTATGEYLEGATVTLAATANEGYTFSHWSKGTETYSTSKSCTAKVASSDNDYVANFLTVGNTTVNVSVTYDSNMGTVTSTSGTVTSGTTLTPYQNEEVTLTAAPVSGYIFTGWTVTQGTESTNYSTAGLTLVATGEMSVTANFAPAAAEYTITTSNIEASNIKNAFCSTWTTSNGITLSCTKGSEVAYALSKSNLTFYATATVGSSETLSTDITYTLTAPEGYLLDSYSFVCYSNSNAYTVDVTTSEKTTNVDRANNHTISQNDINAKSISFTLKTSHTVQASIVISNFTVSLEMEGGAGSGETPATQYTITASASPSTAGSVTGGGTYTEGATVTLTATPNSGYEFVNWTKSGEQVSTNATYSFNATSDAEYVANFQTAASTTYTVTTAANPAEGGSATFAVGTGQATTSASVASGTGITLYADANDGYNFINWTKSGVQVSTDATCNVTITEASNYVANFEPEAATPAVDLSNRYFRIKQKDTSVYMNIYNNTNNNSSTSGVTVASKTINKDAQIFYFIKSNDGYKLQARTGYYITCHDWNANATSNSDGTELTFESTGNELEYLIKWDNKTMNGTVERDDYFKVEKSYIYCDAPSTAAATWVLEEVTLCTVTATASPAAGGTVTPETQTVEQGTSVTLLATANDGYKFVNWTKNGEEVGTDAEYTFTANESTELQANFRVSLNINVKLTDTQGNIYNVQLNDLPNVEIATIEAALLAEYPFLTLGNGNYEATSTLYTNTVELPFKVSNANNSYWHNIYWPSSTNAYPVYMSATTATDTYVSKVTEDATYGSSSYNTYNNNSKISWAIYSVNETLAFKFKNELTGKYIQVTSVANGNAQNCEFVDEADATAFTLEKDAGSYNGDYAITASIDDTQGYLCSTSAKEYDYTTFYNGNGHQGAWVKFIEAEYASKIMDLKYALNLYFGTGEGKRIITDEIKEITDALGTYLEDAGDINLTTLKEYATRIETIRKDNDTWHNLTLAIAPEESGSVAIANESVKNKLVPENYEITVGATPAEGYEFFNWTNDTEPVSTDAEYTFTFTGETNLTANFQKKSYTINVTTGDTNGIAYIGDNATNSSTTVEHGNEITLTAVPNQGYEFVNWTKNGNEAITENPYTFIVTEAGDYVANFKEKADVVTNYTVTLTTKGIDNSKFAVYIYTGTTQNETTKSYAAGSSVSVRAIPDNETVGSEGYVFVGWYNGDDCVSTDKEYTFTINENVALEARFEKGCTVSVKSTTAYVTIYDSEGNAGTGTLLVKSGDEVRFTATPMGDGYRIVWYNTSGNVIYRGTEFTQIVTEDIVYTAVAEAAYYTLTVSTEDTNGTVQAQSGTMDSGTVIEVGYKMTATITATPASGYLFESWTKDDEVVSTDATYTVPAIDDVDAMVDVEYVAHFVEAPEAVAGTYYRIAYDFPVTNAVATVAAGETLEYVISRETGTPNTYSARTNVWTYTKNNHYQADLTLTASPATTLGNINILSENNGGKISLIGYNAEDKNNTRTFTIAVPENGIYKIIGYSINYEVYSGVQLTNSKGVSTGSLSDGTTGTLSESDLNTYSVSFKVERTGNNSSSSIDINSFTVTIQSETIAEPETIRYYMQSEACDVSGKANALLMNENTGASSIFYYAGNKLLSYQKGTYVKEDGDTRGLQSIGATGGDVTILNNGETSTIAAPNYMHANINEGTSKTYFVDHCSSDNGDVEHNFIIEEVTALPVTISAAEQATFYAPVALEIPVGVKAYVLKEKNISTESYATLTRLSRIIPANTGVIIKGAQGDYDFNIVEEDDDAIAEAEGNVFEGTVAATNVNKDAYILAKRNGVVGLFPLSNNSYITGGATATFKNNSHKAYLPVEGNFGELLKKSNGFRFVFDDSIATGIDEVKAGNGNDKTIYDLQGRKLSEITEPGIYIIDGKKVFVK